ncbi:tRNA (adenosine(37)-N6)-dimethylallyltransferase MiaA [Thalassotalea agarivorans]|uniref:tRNA dimethylallyltransferase n=1 Tax=Thalassotalea agarivorans TaxID=349064 RepID=A0A1I0CI87_THASX|nr:tRNA (adenosine(37)-N6)-dimethylallyltransferase MiaA [Thalassotalea agarivorans]SET18857.1 tRNA dimethylallyltransferase [Thalassotalea agarivorans]
MAKTKLPPVVTIMGPTASGKTALAMQLYDQLPCEIVSVDSALVYKGMDIGTAKPTQEELAQYPHQLIDLIDPLESYSAAEFCKDALAQIARIRSQGKVPILVGGTMMYFKSLIDGISNLPEANAAVRAEIEQEAKDKGWPAMHELLASFDAESAERIHPNDPQRLTRAIEVFRVSGHTLSQLIQEKGDKVDGDVLQFALIPNDRKVLHDRIELRFDQMIAQNFEQEVVKLKARGDLHLDLPSIRCVGYRQMWQYLDGEFDHEEMIFRGVCATRQLAKRQLTWLRSWPNVHTLKMEASDNLQQILNAMSKL